MKTLRGFLMDLGRFLIEVLLLTVALAACFSVVYRILKAVS